MDDQLSTKMKILYAAIDLFEAKGYNNCGIREIANRVGIKSSSIYYHFSSKEEILDEIFNCFRKSLFDHIIPVEEIVKLSDTKPFHELMPMIMLSFGSDPERTIMIKVVRIIRSLQSTNKTAKTIFDDVFFVGRQRYINEIFEGIGCFRDEKCSDHYWIIYTISAFEYKMFDEVLSKELTLQEEYETFHEGIITFGRLIENIRLPQCVFNKTVVQQA